MKFSVVTPTRNALDKLKRCVGSVRGQTGVEIEHIVQDACSTDGTPEWLAGQADLLARSEQDAGMYDAINRGWGRATGDILSWLNSDEQYLPGTLEKVAGVFARNPEIDLIYGDALVVDAAGDLRAMRVRRPEANERRLFVYEIAGLAGQFQHQVVGASQLQ